MPLLSELLPLVMTLPLVVGALLAFYFWRTRRPLVLNGSAAPLECRVARNGNTFKSGLSRTQKIRMGKEVLDLKTESWFNCPAPPSTTSLSDISQQSSPGQEYETTAFVGTREGSATPGRTSYFVPLIPLAPPPPPREGRATPGRTRDGSATPGRTGYFVPLFPLAPPPPQVSPPPSTPRRDRPAPPTKKRPNPLRP